MPYSEILFDVTAGVATITLNRPDKLNAWTFTMEKEVRDAVEAAEKDDSVRVIVLTGAGRGFCAGMDMAQLGHLAWEPLPALEPPDGLKHFGEWAAMQRQRQIVGGLINQEYLAHFGLGNG